MKKYLSIIATISILMTLFSCEKEAKDIELPKADPKLVVYGFLSPSDTLIEIELSKSVPYFGEQNGSIDDPVIDATVLLSSEGKTILIPYSNDSRTYRVLNLASFPILSGKTYRLEISSPGGFYVSSETTVPESSPQQVRVEVDSSLRTTNGFSEKIYRILTSWNDEPSQTNFYQNQLKIYQDSLKNEQLAFTFCNYLKSDEGKNGQELRLSCRYASYYSEFDSISNGINGISILYTTDISYYKYHLSLENYIEDNPFAEPSRIYSNIEGGLGCFGSYLATVVEF